MKKSSPTRESTLYVPVKRFLERQGYAVKGEIGGCDLVALRDGEPPVVVIGELKLAFNLELILQGVDRMSACDEVWLAIAMRPRGRDRDTRVRKLCRLLGFGLLGVSRSGRIEVLVDVAPWRPRRDNKRRSRLVREHQRRIGDPMAGGSTRMPVMTAYRQDALACAAALVDGPKRPRDLRADVPDAPKILLRNVYGWFARVERGTYQITDAGKSAVAAWARPQPAAARAPSAAHPV